MHNPSIHKKHEFKFDYSKRFIQCQSRDTITTRTITILGSFVVFFCAVVFVYFDFYLIFVVGCSLSSSLVRLVCLVQNHSLVWPLLCPFIFATCPATFAQQLRCPFFPRTTRISVSTTRANKCWTVRDQTGRNGTGRDETMFAWGISGDCCCSVCLSGVCVVCSLAIMIIIIMAAGELVYRHLTLNTSIRLFARRLLAALSFFLCLSLIFVQLNFAPVYKGRVSNLLPFERIVYFLTALRVAASLCCVYHSPLFLLW